MADWYLYLLWGFCLLLIAAGLAGTILPVLPGVPMVLLGLFVIAWSDGFMHVGWVTLSILAGWTILSLLVDFLATAEGARRFGAGRYAMLGAALGAVVGIFFGLPGLILGPFLGAVAGHLIARAPLEGTLNAGVGASVGVIVGGVAKLAIGVVMVIWFAITWLYY